METLHHVSRPAVIVRAIGFALLLGASSFLWTYGLAPLPDLLQPGMLTLGNLLGTLVIVFAGLAIAATGWLLCFTSQVTILDPAQGKVTKIRDFYLLHREKGWRLSEFSEVVVLWHANHGKERTRYYWSVYLRHSSEALLFVELFAQEEAAETFASQVADRLGLPKTSGAELEWHERHGKPAMVRW